MCSVSVKNYLKCIPKTHYIVVVIKNTNTYDFNADNSIKKHFYSFKYSVVSNSDLWSFCIRNI